MVICGIFGPEWPTLMVIMFFPREKRPFSLLPEADISSAATAMAVGEKIQKVHQTLYGRASDLQASVFFTGNGKPWQFAPARLFS